METLKIQIPEGFQVESFDKLTGEVKLSPKPKNILEVIKTFSDVLDYLGIDEDEFNENNDELTQDEIAYRQIKLIVKALNEGWVPDWQNSNQTKYFPWFKMGSSSGSGFSYDDYDGWDTDSAVGSRLCFKSRELAEYAGKQFTEIYKKYMTI
ncbi:hypothetical protein MP478_04530 [Chryseobacterium sp. WG14]|uniref:hypothetical protein n=1 Tax=Chryseobacterium sp. WG14 TaxID=2926909 RepID=UPI00211F3FE8|nr:hypothetical protein [Chryseobacterium sp. WG14]MCQ9638646.1 hypothetical protein [Chryseobacterium sp. WG14]